MIHSITEWITDNYIELLGAILGLIYIFYSIRQNILTWPVGLASAIFYIVVFFQHKLYAGMALQFYYAAMSIYGWYYWLNGNTGNSEKNIPVKYTGKKQWIVILISSIAVFSLSFLILKNFTDSDVPVVDSLTTTASVVATWMMARKLIENWIIWIVTDLVSVILYIEKGLWATVALFMVFTTMAVVGYFEWKRNIKHQN